MPSDLAPYIHDADEITDAVEQATTFDLQKCNKQWPYVRAWHGLEGWPSVHRQVQGLVQEGRLGVAG